MELPKLPKLQQRGQALHPALALLQHLAPEFDWMMQPLRPLRLLRPLRPLQPLQPMQPMQPMQLLWPLPTAVAAWKPLPVAVGDAATPGFPDPPAH